jgi:NADH dehydrogenase
MKKKVVVIGGGFAGLRLCKELDRKGYDVLLIDRQNHHQFQPLFYQVASARLDPSSISFPFRSIFHRSKRVDVLFAEVTAVVPEEKKIKTDVGDVSYDRLVIATGCSTNYFNNSDLEKYAFSMKTTTEAIQIRNQILLGFEEVAAKGWEACPGSDALVIVGAGPTGVELAGAFAEMKTQMLPGDFPQVDFSRLKILLIESGKETLGNMSEKSRTASGKFLEELGVTIRCGEVVASYDGLNLVLKSGGGSEKICHVHAQHLFIVGFTSSAFESHRLDFGFLSKTNGMFTNRVEHHAITVVQKLFNVIRISDHSIGSFYGSNAHFHCLHGQLSDVAHDFGHLIQFLFV